MTKKFDFKKTITFICLVLSLCLILGSCVTAPNGSDSTSSAPEPTNSPETTKTPESDTTAPPETSNASESDTTAQPETTAPPETTVSPETTAKADDPAVPKKKIAFTFDDGPNYLSTPKVLDKLEEIGAKATFFVVGYNAEKQGKLLKRMVDMGCEVGNHSSGHENFSNFSDEQIIENVSNMNKIIENATGVKPTLLRPPYGNISKEVAAKLGMHIINWSVDPEDWKYRDAEYVSKHIIENVKEGDIILLHDIYQTSYEAFCIAADKLIEEGYEFVTVSELLGLSDADPTSGVIHKSATQKR